MLSTKEAKRRLLITLNDLQSSQDTSQDPCAFFLLLLLNPYEQSA